MTDRDTTLPRARIALMAVTTAMIRIENTRNPVRTLAREAHDATARLVAALEVG